MRVSGVQQQENTAAIIKTTWNDFQNNESPYIYHILSEVLQLLSNV